SCNPSPTQSGITAHLPEAIERQRKKSDESHCGDRFRRVSSDRPFYLDNLPVMNQRKIDCICARLALWDRCFLRILLSAGRTARYGLGSPRSKNRPKL